MGEKHKKITDKITDNIHFVSTLIKKINIFILYNYSKIEYHWLVFYASRLFDILID